MKQFWSIALFGISFSALVHGQINTEILTTVDSLDINGIDTFDFEVEALNPPLNTEWKVTLQLINYFPIVGFSIWFYFMELGLPGIVVTGFEGMPAFINPLPDQSTLFADNFIEGGTLNSIATLQGPIFIPPNCLFDMDVDVANITAPPNCDGISPLSVLEIFIVTPEPATVDQIIIGGPPSFIEQPIVAATVIVMPSTLLPTAAPAPVPAPVPIPIPDPVTVKSDPHLKGIKGQEYDVEGSPGTIYNFITDRDPTAGDVYPLILNARFSQAYTTGIWMSTTSSITAYRPKGTWISDIGLMIGNVAVTVSVSDGKSVAGPDSKHLLRFGSVTLLGSPYDKIGSLSLTDTIEATLYNSKSFSRITIDSPAILLQVDVVSPPHQWQIEREDFTEFSHINLKIERMVLFDAEGLVGETMYSKYDQEGRPIMKSSGANGEGLLKYPISNYAVSHIFCPMLNI